MKTIILLHLLLLSLFDGAILVPGQSGDIDTMAPSSSIVYGETLSSAGGIFELGFFSPGDDGSKHYLGIWFKNISAMTAVWVANRDSPLQSARGSLNLTADGNLVLFNGTGFVVWSAGTSGTVNAALQLLDTGNLVLRGGAAAVWQSIDHPTDTSLAGMKIGLDRRRNVDRYLTSWKTASDPSPGEFSYRMESKGVPQLFLRRGAGDVVYRSGPWNGKGFSGRPRTATEPLFQFAYADDREGLYYTFQNSDPAILMRVYLNEAGDFQRWTWTKGSDRWNLFWKVPEDQCDNYGICGRNGVCTTAYSPPCQCLPGFIPAYPEAWSLRNNTDGCARRTGLNCSTDGFLPVQNVKLPDTVNATAANKTPGECMSWCLSNCSCTAYALIRDTECIVWSGDLLDVRDFADGGDEVYIRLAASELGNVFFLIRIQLLFKNLNPTNSFLVESLRGGGGGARKKKAPKAVIISVAIFVPSSACLLLALWLRCRRRTQGKIDFDFDLAYHAQSWDSWGIKFPYPRNEEQMLELKLYEMSTIRAATSDFSMENLLGEGGFGPVYKGLMEDGLEVAVKRLSKSSTQGIEEFRNEPHLVVQLQHNNLVRLLGCCIEEGERILVYEYMPNKSLDTFIFDRVKSELLDWQTRLKIIEGVARGLLYLHRDSRVKIIHRDLKVSNILLDIDMTPKISDFGMAKIFKADQTEERTERLAGTYGYMSPEYIIEGLFSEKSDVFSFGVILLEILSGKKSRTLGKLQPHKNFLILNAWSLWKEERCLELVDEAMGDSYPRSIVKRFIQVGLLCVQERSDDRPTMENVVVALSSEDVTLSNPSDVVVHATSTMSANEKDWSSSNELTITQLEGR
ncbi:G-type lectin S-receptor-like serine/threonine-protein kinase At4g27290 [Zingiber officinale]|uniref:G-type lectin S-receptor-like serine/threonine-protein kinase At4g27290 n=1 Tax=Zingiber officinale TaxID=94328 RepID=UPI001C4CF9E4|nr:G-type lectin S-receptor-like serine/threonine-protein kinase At4g27290 [Zingiber officinale]